MLSGQLLSINLIVPPVLPVEENCLLWRNVILRAKHFKKLDKMQNLVVKYYIFMYGGIRILGFVFAFMFELDVVQLCETQNVIK